MGKLFANIGDPSDLGLHCLPSSLLRVSRLQWVDALIFHKNPIYMKFQAFISDKTSQKMMNELMDEWTNK